MRTKKQPKNKMMLAATGFGYDYYKGLDNTTGKWFYNVVPTDQPAPAGGYYDKSYILKIKGIPDLFSNISYQ